MILLRILQQLACWLPAPVVRWLGRWLGRLVFDVLRVRRTVVLDNMSRSLGLPAGEIRRLARLTYEHLATGALEMLRLPLLTPEKARSLLGAEALESLRALLARGRGLLVLSGHLGHWDLLACASARAGLPVHVVTRSIKSSFLNRFWMAEREACGVRLLPARGSARAVVSALRRGGAVAMLIDQHEPAGAVIPFFGRAAATSTALARLARVTGAPIVPVFLLRSREGFRLELGEVVELGLPAGDRGADAERVTLQLSDIIERAIRRDPSQWLWLHRRWKASSTAGRRPAGEQGSACTSSDAAKSPPPRDSTQPGAL